MPNDLTTLYAIIGALGGALIFVVQDSVYALWEKALLGIASAMAGFFGSAVANHYIDWLTIPDARGLLALVIAAIAMQGIGWVRDVAKDKLETIMGGGNVRRDL